MSNSAFSEYLYFGGKRIARHDSSGNLDTARKFANIESLLTAGNGLVNAKGTSEFIRNAVDYGLSAAGVASGDSCN